MISCTGVQFLLEKDNNKQSVAKLRLYMGEASGGASFMRYVGTVDLQKWSHVAVTVSRQTSPGTVTFYVDGASIGSVTSNNIPTGTL